MRLSRQNLSDFIEARYAIHTNRLEVRYAVATVACGPIMDLPPTVRRYLRRMNRGKASWYIASRSAKLMIQASAVVVAALLADPHTSPSSSASR